MIDLTKTINQIDGTPFKGSNSEDDLTLGALIISVLSNLGHDEKDGVKKFKRFELALDISKAIKEIKLTSEQIVDIKKLAAPGLPTVSYGRLCELLE